MFINPNEIQTIKLLKTENDQDNLSKYLHRSNTAINMLD